MGDSVAERLARLEARMESLREDIGELKEGVNSLRGLAAETRSEVVGLKTKVGTIAAVIGTVLGATISYAFKFLSGEQK